MIAGRISASFIVERFKARRAELACRERHTFEHCAWIAVFRYNTFLIGNAVFGGADHKLAVALNAYYREKSE